VAAPRCTVAAVDLGASSGRVAVATFDAGRADLHEVHRFPNIPVRVSGVLRWDILSLYAGILSGLRKAGHERPTLDAVGVDSWAVDYGLLDADGQLLGNPVHYRDSRTTAIVTHLLDRIGARQVYAATGIQLQPFNTIFQLLAERNAAQFAAARHALLIPDLINYWLSGSLGTELTNASTTGLIDARTRTWADTFARRLEAPINLFPPLREPGMVIGKLLSEPQSGAALAAAPHVVTVPSHDTAAAVAGVPADTAHFAYVCTGTWALVGVELTEPIITPAAAEANFTNELGGDGTIRFLRNVTGFWLLQECIRDWQAAGTDFDIAALTDAAARLPAARAIIDVQDPGFLAPGDMPRRIAEACLRTSGITLTNAADITRCVLDSMALAVRQAVHDAIRLSDHRVDVVHVVGGGVSNTLFCQLVADACQLPVLAGPSEAASWGNAVFQARALGILDGSLPHARALIRRSQPPIQFGPSGDERTWERAADMVLLTRS
jgi:rhamnulokinase